jgi:hypothetical protein
MTKLMAQVVFGGDDSDPDAAAEEMRRLGYTVHRLPPNHPTLCHPLDDFIEVTIDAPDDANRVTDIICREVEPIADRYGGLCMEVGAAGEDYYPFKDLFSDSRWTRDHDLLLSGIVPPASTYKRR